MLEKHYQPADAEQRIYDAWENAGAFRCGQNSGAKSFSIVIPPPNVTGSLHMGHALNNSLQDILIRFERMRGRDVLWQPGTDHAGIATQMVVERQLAERQQPGRHDMGRAAFLKRVWEWKEESGGLITRQLRRLGASCDWSRERFTMDEGLSRAVTKVFVELHKQGLIYKDKRLVNWDPKMLTAISDLEVEQREVKGHLWHFRYPLADGQTVRYASAFDEDGKPTAWEDRGYIIVATTRPETMLGDTAVAVHPDDERFTHLKGAQVILPLVGRRIPIVFDEHADPEQGSGAVKITPAHDFNDFEVGRRHDLPMINILRRDGTLKTSAMDDFTFGHRAADPTHPTLTHADQDGILGSSDYESIPVSLRGLDRFEARKQIIEMLQSQGLIEKIEEHTHVVPHGDRSGVVIEPFLTDQWYVDAHTLAQPAIKAVQNGQTVFVPRNWEKTYFEWMNNIQPWCISRQLWWGHQIPAWYAPDGEIFVAASEAEALEAAREKFGKDTPLVRDEDVLDTWFSSALWPFSTLGWPDETPELARYYPTDVLVTGFDIIFFWVARMMMMGLHFMKEVPFRTVYIHALVRDEKGQKMSKSKGNVIDPLELIDQFGADALRFTLAAQAAQGRDIKLAPARVEGYRNFVTKLWNAARFSEMNECRRVENFDPASCKLALNRWIGGELARAHARVTEAIEAHRYNDAANALYQFAWHVFCDWYVEFSKPALSGDDAAARDETRAMTAWVFDQLLILMHPVMPFVTEELWSLTGEWGAPRETMLMLARWPRDLDRLIDPAADEEIEWVIRLISAVRSVRAELNVPAGAKIPLLIKDANGETQARLKDHDGVITRLARLSTVAAAPAKIPAGAVQEVLGEATLILPLADVIDIAAERARLQKSLEKLDAEIAKAAAKLGNAAFVDRAPVHVIETERERLAEQQTTRSRLAEAVARLTAAA
ncbi:MAG: valyl-tRNA synthetase [Alphaproteobacteria bacterium]|nr:valyl-tRNA synthetase [Alphaproteobacteria bacterium]